MVKDLKDVQVNYFISAAWNVDNVSMSGKDAEWVAESGVQIPKFW